jgi:hypothetical protein
MLSKAEFRGQRNEDASKHPEDEYITTAASGSSHKKLVVSNFTAGFASPAPKARNYCAQHVSAGIA